MTRAGGWKRSFSTSSRSSGEMAAWPSALWPFTSHLAGNASVDEHRPAAKLGSFFVCNAISLLSYLISIHLDHDILFFFFDESPYLDFIPDADWHSTGATFSSAIQARISRLWSPSQSNPSFKGKTDGDAPKKVPKVNLLQECSTKRFISKLKLSTLVTMFWDEEFHPCSPTPGSEAIYPKRCAWPQTVPCSNFHNSWRIELRGRSFNLCSTPWKLWRLGRHFWISYLFRVRAT